MGTSIDKIIGLAFNNETYQVYDNVNEINDYRTLDGCFRIIKNNNLITDANGFLPTFYDHSTKSVVEHIGYEYKDNPYSPILDNIYMNLETGCMFFYSYPKFIDNIFEYFEEWFATMYSSIAKKYSKVALGVTMGLDSRYLLAILLSRGISPKCYTWGDEGYNTQELFNGYDINLIDIKKHCLKKIKEYVSYYNSYNYKDWNIEYFIYLYYSLIQSDVDVLIEGLGRNFYCTKPRINTSSDLYQIRTSFTCGRAPHILNESIKTFFPFACRDIRYNFRRLNLKETDIVQKFNDRILYLYPKLSNMNTLSYNKAIIADKVIEDEYININDLPKLKREFYAK